MLARHAGVRFSAHAQPHHDCRSGYILIESANEGDGHLLSACALMLMACSAWDDETPSDTSDDIAVAHARTDISQSLDEVLAEGALPACERRLRILRKRLHGAYDRGFDSPYPHGPSHATRPRNALSSGRQDSNLRPPGPQPDALTRLRYAPWRRHLSRSQRLRRRRRKPSGRTGSRATKRHQRATANGCASSNRASARNAFTNASCPASSAGP